MLEYLWSFLWGEPSLSESEKLIQKIFKKLSEQEDFNNLCCFEHRDSQIRLMNLERAVKGNFSVSYMTNQIIIICNFLKLQ